MILVFHVWNCNVMLEMLLNIYVNLKLQNELPSNQFVFLCDLGFSGITLALGSGAGQQWGLKSQIRGKRSSPAQGPSSLSAPGQSLATQPWAAQRPIRGRGAGVPLPSTLWSTHWVSSIPVSGALSGLQSTWGCIEGVHVTKICKANTWVQTKSTMQ